MERNGSTWEKIEMEQTINLHNADCWETLKTLPDGSVHTIITDPPYDIGFMGKDWDKNSLITNVDFWKECLRVLKSGGYLLSFGHSRTSHRMASAIENAGFEIRDTIMWIYGSGFPKSHNVALSIDKKAGAPNRGKAIPVASTNLPTGKYADEKLTGNKVDDYEAKTEQAKDWDGWGTALKPAHEPIVMARKPLEGTVADNVLKHEVGALNIDATRIGSEEIKINVLEQWSGFGEKEKPDYQTKSNTGRWASNVMFGHAEDCEQIGTKEDEFTGGKKGSGGFATGYQKGDDYDNKKVSVPVWKCADGCPVKALDEQAPNKGNLFKKKRNKGTSGGSGDSWTNGGKAAGEDNGFYDAPSGASKFFYCSKVGKKERNAGLDGKPETTTDDGREKSIDNPFQRGQTLRKNNHPTVKPIAVMEWLIKLVSREGQTVLDPFMGSGTTGIAAKRLGRNFIGCEREKDFYEIASARIEHG